MSGCVPSGVGQRGSVGSGVWVLLPRQLSDGTHPGQGGGQLGAGQGKPGGGEEARARAKARTRASPRGPGRGSPTLCGLQPLSC